jgi:hypothetical protein
MLAFGSKRTHGDCRVVKCRNGGKVHIHQNVKNKKFGRQWNKNQTEKF